MNTLSQWTRRTIAVVALAAACLSPSLHAQNSGDSARVKIPFAFDYGTRHFSPGIYTLDMLNPNVMMVRGTSANAISANAISMVQEEITSHPPATSKVVFLKYGDHYVLAEVWVAGNESYLHALRSKTQKRSDIGANRAIASRVEVAMLEQPVSRPR
jgi:hypothetical protein